MNDQKRKELEEAIHEYLLSRGYADTCDILREESPHLANAPHENGNGKSQANLLERKWTMLSRQQHKILQLEAKLDNVQKELESYKSGDVYKKKKQDEKSSLLPVEPCKFELTGHRDSITSLSFHPTYSLIASSSDDASIRIWDYESGELERSLRGHTNSVNYVSYDPTGKWLVSSSADLTIRLWDTGTGESIRVFNGHEHNVSCVIFLPSGDRIVSCSRDNTVRVWDVSTGFCRIKLQEPNWVKRVVSNHDGTLIATSNADNQIRIWSLINQQCLHVLRGHNHVVECISFSDPTPIKLGKGGSDELNGTERDKEQKQTQYLISGCRDKLIHVWNVENGQKLISLLGHDSWVRDAYILPSMKHAISCSDDRSIRIWDLETELCVKRIVNAHPHFVSCLRISRQRPVIATGGVDTNIRIWDCI